MYISTMLKHIKGTGHCIFPNLWIFSIRRKKNFSIHTSVSFTLSLGSLIYTDLSSHEPVLFPLIVLLN